MAEAQNPFLLPPGSTPAPTPPPAAPAPPPDAAPPGHDPDHYIAIPASVESATHRLARPARPTLEPAGPNPAEPNPAGPNPAEPNPALPPDAIAEETLLAIPSVAPHSATVWGLLLPDGARIEITGPTLLGRDPALSPEHPGAQLLPLADPGKTMSKTHVLLEPEPSAGVLLVHDLHSTNGVAVDADGGRTIVVPGSNAPARVGSSIYLGSFLIRVAAATPIAHDGAREYV